MDKYTRESIEKYVKELTGEEISYSTPAPEAFNKIVRALAEAVQWKNQLAGKIDSLSYEKSPLSGAEILELQRRIDHAHHCHGTLPWDYAERRGPGGIDDAHGNFVVGEGYAPPPEVVQLLCDCVSAVPRLISANLNLQRRLEIAESFISGDDGSSYSRTLLEAKV